LYIKELRNNFVLFCFVVHLLSMKRKQLLQPTVLFFTLLFSINSKAQEIESYTVLGLNTPPTVNVISQFPHDGFEFTHFEMVNPDFYIVTIDLFFKECTGDVGPHYIDTTYAPISAWAAVPHTIIIRIFVDSNTVDLNCVINPTPTIADVDTIIVSELNITEQSLDEFLIYPNPATTELQLNNLLRRNVQRITLLSSTGQFIKNYSPTSSVLSLNGVLPGYYILEIANSNRVVRKKIIIK